MRWLGRYLGFGIRQSQVRFQALHLSSCGNLIKLLNLCVSQCTHLSNGDNNGIVFKGFLWGLSEVLFAKCESQSKYSKLVG